MHVSLGQHGFGTKKRDYATAPKGGGRVQRFTKSGRMAPGCPAGARSVGTGSYGTGANTVSYNDCELAAPRPAPVAPPPPPPPPVTVTAQISPAIQTQVSPQVSPVLTQMQDSPGAGVVASPQQIAPAPMTSQPRLATGLDPEVLREQIQREMRLEFETERMAEAQAEFAAERAQALEAEVARQAIADEDAARQQAAQESEAAGAAYMPVGLPPVMGPGPAPVEVSTEVEERPFPMPVLLLVAAAGVGVLILARGKKKGRKR